MDSPNNPKAALILERDELRRRLAALDAAIAEDAQASAGPTVYGGAWPSEGGAQPTYDTFRAREKHLRCLLERGWDMITLHDNSGRIQYMNGAGIRQHGFTLDEIRTRPLGELIHPDDLPSFLETMRALLADPGGSRRHEARFFHKAGGVMWLELAAVNMLHDPDLQAILCTTRDVTVRKQAELALAESRSFLVGVLDSLASHIAVVGADGTIVAVNAAWLSTDRSFLGAACRLGDNYIHACDRVVGFGREAARAASQGIREVLSTVSSTFEIEYGAAEGASAARFILRVTRVSGPGPAHAVVSHADVSKRFETEQALRRSEERFRRVLESSWDIIAIAGTEHRYFYVSSSVERVLGYTAEEFCQIPIIDLIHPDDRERAMSIRMSNRAKPGGAASIEHRLRHKDGHYVWMEHSGVNRLADPAVKGVVVNMRDITERRIAHEALENLNAALEQRVVERTAALERANRAKDEFLASMSHELRTPLNAVLGLSEAMQEGIYGAVEEKARGALKRIEESGRHLLSLINDILDLSKLEAGKTQLDWCTVSIADVCRASMAMVQETAQKRRQVLSFRLTDPSVAIYADERRLKQILVNLLSNAVKFTPEGGVVGLEVMTEDDERIRFTVWDNGIGIAPDDLLRLFQPFVQLDSSLSRRHAGTGLGLALVRKLVNLHGGLVYVESELGKGSRFSAVLPGRRNAPDPISLTTPPFGVPLLARPTPLQRPTILVAEDDETNVTTVSDFLKARGYDVQVATNGQEAVDMARRLLPAVILMDVQMPIMDGLSAIRAIRADRSALLREMPVVALTALAMVGDRERCIEAGANDYLTKPVRLKQLAALLSELIASRPPG